MRVVVSTGGLSNVYNIDPHNPSGIPGVTFDSLEGAIRSYLQSENPRSTHSRTYMCRTPHRTGVRVHLRGSDGEPKGSACQGRP
ncbi:MAG: hypothetical protein ISS48_02460 [Candidatus Aenigmarchaeota archaeon]|nr:hypothetical protein [Candidatus Aenigmarchaeota archaeon]